MTKITSREGKVTVVLRPRVRARTRTVMGGLALLALLSPFADAQASCVPTLADPSTYNRIDATGRTFYLVEDYNGDACGSTTIGPITQDGCPPLPVGPVPGSGQLGDGTWF